MSVFDPTAFLDAQQSEVNEKRPPLPEENPESSDGLYMAILSDIKEPKSGTITKGDNTGNPWVQLPVLLKIDVPSSLRAAGAPSQVTITDGVFIDLTAAGTIDNGVGKNNRQRLYREALRMNKPGEAFSWRAAIGRPLKVKVKHELYNDTIQERVGSVFPA